MLLHDECVSVSQYFIIDWDLNKTMRFVFRFFQLVIAIQLVHEAKFVIKQRVNVHVKMVLRVYDVIDV